MKPTRMMRGILQRLPGNRHLRILKECLDLCRQFPQTSIYRTILRLNLRAYFCIHPHYGPFWCKEEKPEPSLYHVTERANLPSIQANGLQNTKTGVVFLMRTLEQARTRAVTKQLQDPVFLLIDSKQMYLDGFCFYVNQEWNHIWIVQEVPERYIHEFCA